MMTIQVNDEQKDVQSDNIYDLLTELDIKHQGRNVNINGVMVHWTKFKEFHIKDQDVIVVVNYIAGG